MFKNLLQTNVIRIAGLTLAGGLLAGSVPALAHHAFGAEFDPNRPMVLRGPVVRVEWVNPHTWIHMEVTQEDGSTEVWISIGFGWMSHRFAEAHQQAVVRNILEVHGASHFPAKAATDKHERDVVASV